jgi:hypothetical protein
MISFAPEHNQAVTKEAKKLMQAKFIKEVQYFEWLSNVVMVMKASRKRRMCIDFTDLNKTCPEGSFLLPQIDLLVDFTAKHGLRSLMDSFSGYNQIRMYEHELLSFMDELLSCMVSQQGIDANLEKMKVILERQPPPNVKELQQLTGKVVVWTEEYKNACPFSRCYRRLPDRQTSAYHFYQ